MESNLHVLTGRRYFLASLALPVGVPVVVGALAALTSSELMAGFAAIFLFSLVLGGIPYLFFAAGVILWSRKRSLAAIRRLSFIAPLLFVVLICTLSPLALPFGASIHEIAGFLLMFSFYALIFGYLYVFIVNCGYEFFLAKRAEK